MRVIESRDLTALSAQAAQLPRRRLNINLHADSADSVQRMVIAFEPEAYIRPHRHSLQFETFVLLRGRGSLLSFAGDGIVDQRIELAEDGARVVEIPAGIWHSLVSQAPGTLVVEVKPGPYRPTAESDFAAWAPPEGHADAGACRDWMRSCSVGDRFGSQK
ncbi:WbuC family cupin fold metalloprotein [Magnetospirillum sp. 15-1]|uniref:WbuC family cupin fold metalloprotein n=1 Tax=Magnetospirillum sp. 15-1 TaxID=1979370 RepID=UPI000BBB7F41|nr:WbuC family cupin fold metalloprotein [Magnetospirillum sp. 15-1]